MKNRYSTYPEIEYNYHNYHTNFGVENETRLATSVRIERNGKFYFTDVVVYGRCLSDEDTKQLYVEFHRMVYVTMLHFKPTSHVDRWGYPVCREDDSTLTEKDRLYYKYLAPLQNN